MSTNTIDKFQFQNVPSAEDGGLVINAEVRVVVIDGEPWWVAKDVCGVLGIANVSDALSGLDQDERNTLAIAEGNRGNPNVGIINESGLYSLILRSRKPEAKAFKKWVTSVVLPTIRKTGAYIDPTQELFQKIADGDTDAVMQGLQMSIQIAQEARAKLVVVEAEKIAAEAALEEAKPYVEASKEFFDMDGLYCLRDAARKLGIPPYTFNDHLRAWGWIDERGTGAKAYAVRQGYAVNRIYVHPGSGAGTTQGRLTGKGLGRAAIKLEKEGTWVGYPAL